MHRIGLRVAGRVSPGPNAAGPAARNVTASGGGPRLQEMVCGGCAESVTRAVQGLEPNRPLRHRL